MAQTYELDLPFCLPREFLDYNVFTQEVDWEIYLAPINPVVSVGGITPRVNSIQIFFSYSNVMLERVIPQGAEAPPGVVSRSLALASELSARLPFTFAGPLSRVAAIGASVAQFAGYSRPPVEPETTNVVRFNQNLASMMGQPDFAFGLGVDPYQSRNLAQPLPLEQPGETGVHELMRRWSQIKLAWPVGPTHEFEVWPTAAVDSGYYYPTTLGFVSAAFQYWSGDMELCIEVVSSPLIRWRIGVVIVPPGIAPPILFPTSGFITHVIETAGTTCEEITIPYLYTDPFQRSVVSTFSSAALGRMRVCYYSLTEPTGPSATPILPYVNVWIRAGENFTVGVPSLEPMEYYKYHTQGKGVGEQSMSIFGEVIDDIGVLMKRTTKYATVDPQNEIFPGEFSVPVLPVGPIDTDFFGINNTTGYFRTNWDFISYFSPAYLCNSGGIVHRMYQEDNTTIDVYEVANVIDRVGGARTLKPSFANWDDTSRGYNMFRLQNNPMAEVRVPDRNPYMFRTSSVWIAGDTREFEVLRVDNTTAAQHRMAFCVSAADDFRLAGFLAPPPYIPRL
jgi:hypothetical protein